MKKEKIVRLLAVILFFLCGVTFMQCKQENELDNFVQEETFSKVECEAQLKKQVNDLLQQKKQFEESFVGKFGLPLWGNAKWISVNSKEMWVIPLLSTKGNSKFIVGTICDGKVCSVITESLVSKAQTTNRLYSLQKDILFESNSTGVVRVKSRSFESYACFINLLTTGGSVEDVFKAESQGARYDPKGNLGKLSIVVGDATDEGGGSSFPNTSGHAWLKFETLDKQSVTFSLWSRIDGGSEYLINEEGKHTYSKIDEYSVNISFEQFQKILDWNSTPSHKEWHFNHNCSTYTIEIWKEVTGENIPSEGMFTVPKDVADYIKSKKNEDK